MFKCHSCERNFKNKDAITQHNRAKHRGQSPVLQPIQLREPQNYVADPLFPPHPWNLAGPTFHPMGPTVAPPAFYSPPPLIISRQSQFYDPRVYFCPHSSCRDREFTVYAGLESHVTAKHPELKGSISPEKCNLPPPDTGATKRAASSVADQADSSPNKVPKLEPAQSAASPPQNSQIQHAPSTKPGTSGDAVPLGNSAPTEPSDSAKSSDLKPSSPAPGDASVETLAVGEPEKQPSPQSSTVQAPEPYYESVFCFKCDACKVTFTQAEQIYFHNMSVHNSPHVPSKVLCRKLTSLIRVPLEDLAPPSVLSAIEKTTDNRSSLCKVSSPLTVGSAPATLPREPARDRQSAPKKFVAGKASPALPSPVTPPDVEDAGVTPERLNANHSNEQSDPPPPQTEPRNQFICTSPESSEKSSERLEAHVTADHNDPEVNEFEEMLESEASRRSSSRKEHRIVREIRDLEAAIEFLKSGSGRDTTMCYHCYRCKLIFATDQCIRYHNWTVHGHTGVPPVQTLQAGVEHPLTMRERERLSKVETELRLLQAAARDRGIEVEYAEEESTPPVDTSNALPPSPQAKDVSELPSEQPANTTAPSVGVRKNIKINLKSVIKPTVTTPPSEPPVPTPSADPKVSSEPVVLGVEREVPSTFTCDECHSIFSSRARRDEHMTEFHFSIPVLEKRPWAPDSILHDIALKYVCTPLYYCLFPSCHDKTPPFVTPLALKQHSDSMHQGKEIWCCDEECMKKGQTFHQQLLLREHIRIVHMASKPSIQRQKNFGHAPQLSQPTSTRPIATPIIRGHGIPQMMEHASSPELKRMLGIPNVPRKPKPSTTNNSVLATPTPDPPPPPIASSEPPKPQKSSPSGIATQPPNPPPPTKVSAPEKPRKKTFTCPLCDKEFASQFGLKIHNASAHPS